MAGALEARGGGVLRSVAIIEGSLAAADLPASTFESIGTGARRGAELQHQSIEGTVAADVNQAAQSFLSHLGTLSEQSSMADFGECRHSLLDQVSPVSVIENIAHLEPAAEINEHEAAQVAAMQHVGFVERNLGQVLIDQDRDFGVSAEDSGSNCELPDLPEKDDRIIIGKLNRLPKSLREELSGGASLRACRNALEAAGHPWKLLPGALVFVHPRQYRAVVSALSFDEIRPYHVIFSESLRYLLEETLARCKGVWFTACVPLYEHIGSMSEFGDASDVEPVVGNQWPLCDINDDESEHEGDWIVCIQRSFLCLAHRCISLEKRVTSSARDEHQSYSANPRIVALQREFLWEC